MMDAGDWIMLASVALMVVATVAFFALAAPRTGRPGTLGFLSTALTIISVAAAYGVGYLGEHHDDIEWMSGNVLGAVSLLMLATFFEGLAGAAVSTRRAIRQHAVSAGVISVWIVYAAILTFGAYETIRAL